MLYRSIVTRALPRSSGCTHCLRAGSANVRERLSQGTVIGLTTWTSLVACFLERRPFYQRMQTDFSAQTPGMVRNGLLLVRSSLAPAIRRGSSSRIPTGAPVSYHGGARVPYTQQEICSLSSCRSMWRISLHENSRSRWPHASGYKSSTDGRAI